MALDQTFPERQKAALVLSKVFFHMEQWEDSIRLALLSGPLFNIRSESIYNKTILTKAIDKYVHDKAYNASHPQNQVTIDAALEAVVEEIIKQCLVQKDFKQVIGISLDSCRLDVLQAALSNAVPAEEYLRFTQRLVISHGKCLAFQERVLSLLIEIAEKQADPDYVFICDCLVTTQDVIRCNDILIDLAKAEDRCPLAYQIAFNLYEIGPEFAKKVCQLFMASIHESGEYKKIWSTWNGSPGEKLFLILSGQASSNLFIRFLSEKNETDMLILERTREAMNLHNSQHHSSVYYSNGISQCGTTNDEFLRKNMDWLSYASNWAKFNAAASIGMIHRGHVSDSRTVLKPYLPQPGHPGSPYAEGGALFAMGLIHSQAEPSEVHYLKEHLNDSEVIQHGACLGIGAAALASHDHSILNDIRAVLYSDNAVSGEAAALSIGLVMAGSRDAGLVDELLGYARETQHEKIIRSIGLASALIYYGAKDNADLLIDALLNDKDVILRYGAMWMIALAYVGTNDNGAIRRLLHAAVSESDDDVRRAAVTALGLVLYRNPEELPQLLSLLSSSFNPHVRYGVALALGIAFVGTGNQEAIDLIKPMCKDLTDFVRQGAYLALSLILQQLSEVQSSEVGPTRKLLETVATNKYEDAIARFGAVLSQGLIDAGGRNAALSLTTSSGHSHLPSIVGTMMFCQFWYWYPCIGFLSLALRPTDMIAVDGTLEPPVCSISCAAPPKQFAYPPPTQKTQVSAPKKLTTAVLSTTAKAQARARKTGKSTTDLLLPNDAMDVDEIEPSPALTIAMEIEVEPQSFSVSNFSRVTVLQRSHLLLDSFDRFIPVSMSSWSPSVPITVVKDTQSGQPIEYLSKPKLEVKEDPKEEEPKTESTEKADNSMEVEPPKPFPIPDI